MTLRVSCLIMSLLMPALSLAQSSPTTPRPAVRPPATRPAETPPASNAQSIGDAANRQQELYDQHHGIKRKPANPVTSAPPVATDNRPSADFSTDESNLSGVRIGLRGGVTLPVYLEKQSVLEPALGFVGGVSFTFGKGAVAFQPEINYTRMSTKTNLLILNPTVAADYVQVPLLLKFQSGTYAGSRFFLNVGPYGSYLLSGSLNGRKIDLTGSNGRFGFGAALGIGTAVKAGPGHVTIELRGLYELGDTDNGFNADSKTILSQATLGYIVPLGGR